MNRNDPWLQQNDQITMVGNQGSFHFAIFVPEGAFFMPKREALPHGEGLAVHSAVHK